MNKQQYINKIKDLQEELENIEFKLKSLKMGDFVYERDTQDLGGAFFKHEVVSVDLNELIVNTLDHSRKLKPCKLDNWDFYTAKEAKMI